MKRMLAAIAVVVLLPTVAACSSDASDAAPTAAAPTDMQAPPDGDNPDGGTADPATDAPDDAEIPGSGTPGCAVLMTLYQDITTLPQRVEADGVSAEAADEIIAPAEAMKADLPGQVGTVLPILKNDLKAAVVMSSAADIEEYFGRSTHELAVQELISSTRTACELPSSWPEAG